MLIVYRSSIHTRQGDHSYNISVAAARFSSYSVAAPILYSYSVAAPILYSYPVAAPIYSYQ